MYVIDTNSLVVLLLGMLDTKHLGRHKRASIYDEDDYNDLVDFIGSLNNLLVIPNVWTEVDNLLNDFSGEYKYPYITQITNLIKEANEQYLESYHATSHIAFIDLGVTDSILLTLAKDFDALITADSKLSDYAQALGTKVYDMVQLKQEKLLKY